MTFPPKNLKKHLVLLGYFFFTCFKRPGIRFRFQAIVYYFIHSFSSKFYSNPWSLIIPHKNFLNCRLLLGFCSTYFKRTRLGFPNYGFHFKHSFTFIHSVSSTFYSKSSSLIIRHNNYDKRRALLDFFARAWNVPY